MSIVKYCIKFEVIQIARSTESIIKTFDREQDAYDFIRYGIQEKTLPHNTEKYWVREVFAGDWNI